MGRSYRDLGLAVLIIGGFSRKPAVILLGASLVAISMVALLLSKLSIRDLVYERKITSPFAFFGDQVELEVKIKNNKPLPVDVVCLDEVDNTWRFEKKDLEPHYLPYRAILANEVHLGGYETVNRKFTLTCEKRGVFAFGPATMRSQDPLGLYRSSTEVAEKDTIIVYPKVLPINDQGLQDLYPFGKNPKASWVYQDPLFLKTMRPYQPQDPLKHVDWKATARIGQLQSRVFDMAFGHRVMLCVNFTTVKNPWDAVDTSLFEVLVTAASSMAYRLVSQGFSVGLVSNGISVDRQGYHFVAECSPGNGEQGLKNLLSCLAGLGYYTFEHLSTAADRAWASHGGAYKVILSASFNPEFRELLRSPQARKDSLLVVVGDAGETDLASLPADLDYPGPVLYASLKGGWEHAGEIKLSRVS